MDVPGTSLKETAVDCYYRLARKTAVRHLHNQLRCWRHRWRYGVNSAFMFRNVELEINSMCNRKCGYCPNVSAQRPSGYMDESLFEKIVRELAEMDFDGNVSYHFYGEPLLDRRLSDLVEFTARQANVCLGFDERRPWPTWIEGPAGIASVSLQPGDGLLYRGIECPHWRLPFEGSCLARVLLHYVDQHGRHAEWKFDQRASLTDVQHWRSGASRRESACERYRRDR